MIYVSSLAALDIAIARHGPSHLMTLLDPATLIDTPQGFSSDRHLKVGVNDIGAPEDGLIHPADAHVRDIVGFVEGWDRRAPMLIHCWAGVSRSTAAAFIAACMVEPETPEEVHAQAIRAAAAYANPNRLIVELADTLLGRKGRMTAALDAIGPGDFDHYPSVPIFGFPLRGGAPV